MEEKEFLEGKKTDNLEVTSASDEAELGNVGEKSVEEKSEKEISEPVPNLSTAPVPTEDEIKDAELNNDLNNDLNGIDAKEEIDNGADKLESEPEKIESDISEPEQSEPTPAEAAPIENVETDLKVEENGVTEMPATKVFTQSQVNEMVGNTRTETREKTFRYVYDRYGVKDEAELDELVGNAQALDSFKEKFETERAEWKKTGADRDKELMDVKEQVALLQSGIDSDRFEDAKLILRGKGLEVSLDNIKNEIATHPEWQKKVENENFVKTGESEIKDTEPSSKISVLGNEVNGGDEPKNSEEDYVMNRMFKIS
ncbi:MAG: hypothetical protein K5765_06915 [Clostridia bacterium]|nr:hypothetical protein [Clostridia bacterium]